VAEFRAATPDQAQFLDELSQAGLLIGTGQPGVFGCSGAFDDIRDGLDALITRSSEPDGAERLSFPPVMPRRQMEANGYLKSFPHLAGTIFSFAGTEAQAAEQHERASRHEDWSGFQTMTELVLTPAACYPVYPALAARGALPSGGVTVDTGAALVFRNEPSGDPARLQMFHMRELVRLGEPDAVAAWRDAWRDRALDLLCGLGLDARLDVASDPFFGRGGRMLAASQRQQALKFEIVVPIAGAEPTAVASFNYHQDHFGHAHGLTLADGEGAHTACLGFGLERVILALLHAHGLDASRWPAQARHQLWGS